ncbi:MULTISPECIES: 2-isopropylmalate synthase [unclassified Streptomyces]|uniref:2-isopropylmalate synthase n=1 Tax=unclassified Streptomyces TaxID=2593676 RepID=UPI00203585F7|nr:MULTISPECIES: 2-isopropylmalate synthase [unclassified Streptomyces]
MDTSEPGRDRGAQRSSLMPVAKYLPYRPIQLADRTWPDRVAQKAPLWCSVDLRDGNQALIDPMDVDRKRRMFDLLVSMGFKEIEVGYPTASRDDHDFVRHLIERDAIPDDVVIQVMAPIRQDFIERTVHCLRGARRAVLQVFNPTSEVQRRLVLRAGREEVRALALDGAEQALRLQDSLPGTELYLQYAPESYTQTEPDYALDLCNAVLDFWAPRARSTLRINLPATVEVFPPQEFADRIEYMHRNLAHRERVLLSVHPHNDRGSGVAAAELAVLAGADRVEGTLFGNGERTGNVCLITLAMNLLTQGIDPMLDLREVDRVRRIAEDCTQMPVPPRHPWAGDFVYTSFAGTHQDAISKGLRARQEAGDDHTAVWEVPYLPVDPRDIGRDYQALIRINTQSGKGGIAHLLRRERGLDLPRRLQIDFAAVMQRVCEQAGGEVSAHELWLTFEETYVLPGLVADRGGPAVLAARRVDDAPGDWADWARAALAAAQVEGAVRDFVVAPAGRGGEQFAAYCELTAGDRAVWGVGLDESPADAARRALWAAVQRAARSGRRAAPVGRVPRPAAVPAGN